MGPLWLDEGGSCVGEIRWRAGGERLHTNVCQHQPTIGFPNASTNQWLWYIYIFITLIKLCYHIPKPNSVSLAVWSEIGNLEIPDEMEVMIVF